VPQEPSGVTEGAQYTSQHHGIPISASPDPSCTANSPTSRKQSEFSLLSHRLNLLSAGTPKRVRDAVSNNQGSLGPNPDPTLPPQMPRWPWMRPTVPPHGAENALLSQKAPRRWSEPLRQTDIALPAAALLQGGTIKPRFHPGAPITERQPRFYRTDLIPEAPERHGPREGLRRRNSVERAYLGEKHSL
jgi:hypothetical protein